MSAYFTLPSFARAKKNTEDLEKTNPQKPVLNEEDEKFLERHMSQDRGCGGMSEVSPTVMTDEGEEKEATVPDQKAAGVDSAQVAIPETRSDGIDGEEEGDMEETKQHDQTMIAVSSEESKIDEKVDDPPEQIPDDGRSNKAETAAPARKPKKDKGIELPSQEEAEAATAGWGVGSYSNDKPQTEKRTWASYLPSMASGGKKDETAEGSDKSAENTTQTPQRTWKEYASALTPSSLPAMPNMPAIPSLPTWLSKDKDANAEPVYNEDGSINEAKTKEKQEKEVSVLLDNLNLSAINNRVFAFSSETQKIYERFAQVLRDTMNGAPTAYEDMEKLMKDAGPQLEKQFKSMPPFVQTLVKSLPAKLGTTLGPELLAVASDKPGADMKARMTATEKNATRTASSTGKKSSEKSKKKIPGLKGLVSSQGAAAGILRNTVTFVQTRFPFLASASNVVMSLSVFILMFTFWYCHKRGKETRLAREQEQGKLDGSGLEGDDEDLEVEVSDDNDDDDDDEKVDTKDDGADAKNDVLNQAHPKDVPLPEATEEEKTSTV
ncbi:Hypothetical protein R9X50_00218600 [Acrodontium crateriforme]|uniref:Uncharacterized protein n=1 Tax=Acrodontium crateriforme TaxID=150365 RepID=A0AAQ3M111_9PEZI|nr:Hypothetical protein R9X50_00218600 [Acrodontium crateriforme]